MADGSCEYSILIVTKNRDSHLLRVLEGIDRQNALPVDVVVVFINQPRCPPLNCRVPTTPLALHDDAPLPLARARNTAAQAAKTDRLVFLDVDCIPADDFGSVISADLVQYGGLVMGTPRYLRQNFDPSGDLDTQSESHPARSALNVGTQMDYTTFWSLCFATHRSTFRRIGGFDEQFIGYGAEDTDLAFTYQHNTLPFAISPARVFHQFHASYRPPLNHLRDIVSNAQRFHEKWRTWPMSGWLRQFEAMQLVEWQPEQSVLRVIRAPTAAELEAAETNDLFA